MALQTLFGEHKIYWTGRFGAIGCVGQTVCPITFQRCLSITILSEIFTRSATWEDLQMLHLAGQVFSSLRLTFQRLQLVETSWGKSLSSDIYLSKITSIINLFDSENLRPTDSSHCIQSSHYFIICLDLPAIQLTRRARHSQLGHTAPKCFENILRYNK